MPSLADQFCPNVHQAPITAADFDPHSGAIATADGNGVIAVQRGGEATPQLVFNHGTGPVRALRFVVGGSLLAVGDDLGSIGVFRTDTGDVVFSEVREGERGRVRAFRGVALSPDGSHLAAIAIDGLLRVWDLRRSDRNAWRGFGGNTVDFGPRGQRLLAIDDGGQPRMMDMHTLQTLTMDRLQTAAQFARFSRDGTSVLVAGPAGLSMLRVVDGALITSFATKGGSGISNLLLSPDGRQVAAITGRSVHTFQLPNFDPVDSTQHGVESPTGAAFWSSRGIQVAGEDGAMHLEGAVSLAPAAAVTGLGHRRVVAHGAVLAVWSRDRRAAIIQTPEALRNAQINRNGSLVVTTPVQGPVRVFDRNGGEVFDCGPETVGTPQVAIGGHVVAAALPKGGLRWWDLGANQAFELSWPTSFALSGSGTWLGVVTPQGTVQVINPATGEPAIPDPAPLAEVPTRLICFVNRQPQLLVLDQEGVLGHYDLTASVKQSMPAEGRDVLTINVPVNKMWGITGGEFCALRLDEGKHATILFVNLTSGQVVAEVTQLHPRASVDAESGHILQPARSAGVLELDSDGREVKVLRSLTDGQWLSFGHQGIIDASEGAAGVI